MSKKKTTIAAAVSVVAAALAISGCGSAAPASSPGTATESDRVSVSFVGAAITDPYYLTMRCGAEAAGEEFDIDVDWQGINSVDFAPQVTLFNTVVQTQPDGIVLVPFSATAFVDPARTAIDSGIQVVTADAPLDTQLEIRNVRTDNLALGALAADAMLESIGGTGTVAVISFAPDIPIQADRVNGFVEQLSEIAPDVEVVAVEYGGADSGKAAQKVAALLQRFPDLSGVFATDTADAEGAGSAIEAAGQRGIVKLIAYDASPALVTGLKDGLYDALIAQAPFEVGYESFKAAAQAVRGEIATGDEPFWIKTAGAVLTRDNIDSPDVANFIYKESC